MGRRGLSQNAGVLVDFSTFVFILHTIYTFPSPDCYQYICIAFFHMFRYIYEYHVYTYVFHWYQWCFWCIYRIETHRLEEMWVLGIMGISVWLIVVWKHHIDALMKERRNSIANALELCLSYTNPSIWWHKSGSALALVMAWYLTAPSQYLSQYWLIIICVLLNLPEINFTRIAYELNL